MRGCKLALEMKPEVADNRCQQLKTLGGSELETLRSRMIPDNWNEIPETHQRVLETN